jgi:DNA (cytosine-5)-methyltransferase 1
LVVEINSDACETVRTNQKRRLKHMRDWPLREADVSSFDFGAYSEGIDLLAGGVPCQPFSIGGKHKGYEDLRNMFPAMLRAVREIRPRAVLVENVRGLTRPAFAKYFGYIELMLMYPEIRRTEREDWLDHLARLERYHTFGKPDGLHYRVVHRVLNAADFGVPQRRERVFLVAIRSDVNAEFSFPERSHSSEALLWDQFGSKEYWERHCIPRKKRPEVCGRMSARLQALSDSLLLQQCKPWATVRDAIGDLPSPCTARGCEEPSLTHFAIPGARSYPGHTGSPLDQPAKTLKAGDHGVPGGENMLVDYSGRVRYFSIRESARLQTFPDGMVFPGSWTESMRQIGNAVPVELGRLVGSRLGTTLAS